jgi:hypothetical protein
MICFWGPARTSNPASSRCRRHLGCKTASPQMGNTAIRSWLLSIINMGSSVQWVDRLYLCWVVEAYFQAISLSNGHLGKLQSLVAVLSIPKNFKIHQRGGFGTGETQFCVKASLAQTCSSFSFQTATAKIWTRGPWSLKQSLGSLGFSRNLIEMFLWKCSHV